MQPLPLQAQEADAIWYQLLPRCLSGMAQRLARQDPTPSSWRAIRALRSWPDAARVAYFSRVQQVPQWAKKDLRCPECLVQGWSMSAWNVVSLPNKKAPGRKLRGCGLSFCKKQPEPALHAVRKAEDHGSLVASPFDQDVGERKHYQCRRSFKLT